MRGDSTIFTMSAHAEYWNKQLDISSIIGRLLCRLGFHDFQIVGANFGFSNDDNVEKIQCRRYEVLYSRQV
jgi:hypothetical protein